MKYSSVLRDEIAVRAAPAAVQYRLEMCGGSTAEELHRTQAGLCYSIHYLNPCLFS